MQLPRPHQISTDPGVNVAAMQWANLFLTQLEQSILELAQKRAGTKIDFGAATLTYPGTSQQTTALLVNHNLGVVPVIVIATMDNSVAFSECQVGLTSATQLTLRASTVNGANPAGGTQHVAYWLAIA